MVRHTALCPIIEHSMISLVYKSPEMYIKGCVPCLFISKGAFNGGSGVIPWQSYPKMIDKRYMKNGRSDTPCS